MHSKDAVIQAYTWAPSRSIHNGLRIFHYTRRLPMCHYVPLTVIASDEAVTILGLELTILVLLRLLHCNIHEAIQARQDT